MATVPAWVLQAPTGPTTGAALIALIRNLTNWLFVGFMFLAVIFIILAAWQFISSRGEPQAVLQARTKFLWAAVAVVAAVISRGVAFAIGNIIL